MKTPRLQPLASLFGAVLLSAMSAFAAPSIVSPPGDVPVAVIDGKVATLSVSASSDSNQILAYQWYKKGTPEQMLANGNGYAGVTTATLRISGAKAIHSGDYELEVWEPANQAEPKIRSPIFTVTVNVRPKIKDQPVPLTKDQGEGASFTVTLTPETTTTSILYQWQKNNVDISNAVNASAITSTLEIPAADMDNPGVQWPDVGNYRLKITSPLTNTTIISKAVALKINSGPYILKQPAADTAGKLYVAAGATGKLSVLVGGSPKLTYAWKKEGSETVLGTAATLTVKSDKKTPNAAEGRYRVEVSNTYAAPGDPPGVNTVTSEYAEVIVFNKLTELTPIKATYTVDSVEVPLTPADKGAYLGETDLPGLRELTLTADPKTADTDRPEDPMEFQWQKDGKNISDESSPEGTVTGTNTAVIKFSPLRWKYRGTYRCIIKNKVGTLTTKTFVLKVNSKPVILTEPVDTVGPLGGKATFTVVAGGTAPLKYQWYRGNDDSPITKGGTAAKLSLSNLQDSSEGIYYCRVTNTLGGDDNTEDTVHVSLQVDTPVALNRLSALDKKKEVKAGTSLTLTLTTSKGDGPISYQWQRNNKNLLNGAGTVGSYPSSITYTIDPVDNTTIGNYRCLVSNVNGLIKVTSDTIAVKALQTPAITEEPEDQEVYEDSKVIFTVKAGGSPPLRYKWFKDGTLKQEGSSPTLTLPSVIFQDAGDYYCVVTNNTGEAEAATSETANLQVLPVPAAEVSSMTPAMAQTGDKVRITGNHMKYVLKVKFGGSATLITPVRESDTSILVTVPSNASQVAAPIELLTKRPEIKATTADFTRSLKQVNDRRYPKIVTGTSFPEQSGVTDAALDLFLETLPAEGLGEAVYTWIAPKAGTYYILAEALSRDFQINLRWISTTATDYDMGWPRNAQVLYMETTKDNEPVTFQVYGLDGWGTPGLIDYGPYRLNCTFLGAAASTTGFSSAEGLVAGQTLAGQAGWNVEGAKDSAQVMKATEQDQAATFTGSSSESGEATVLWKDTSDVQAGPDSVVHTEWTMSIDQAGAGTEGHYGWQVTGADGSPLAQLQFSVADGAIYLVQQDGTRTLVEPSLNPGAPHRFEIATDLGNDTWQARIDGVSLGDPLPLPATAGFGDVSVIWYPSSSQNAQPTMTFDNVSITVD